MGIEYHVNRVLAIAVVNLKGGSGKTTLVVTLGTCLHRAGHRVLLVDADKQGSLAEWARQGEASRADNPRVVAMDVRSLQRGIDGIAQEADVCIIDTPPRLAAAARGAILEADLVLVPTVPGGPDAWALRTTLDVVAEAQTLRPELRAVVVPNRLDLRTVLSRMTLEALEALNVQVLEVGLGARVAVTESLAAGQGVVDYAPASRASEEAQALTAAVLAAVRAEEQAAADDDAKSHDIVPFKPKRWRR